MVLRAHLVLWTKAIRSVGHHRSCLELDNHILFIEFGNLPDPASFHRECLLDFAETFTRLDGLDVLAIQGSDYNSTDRLA